jgi:transcriptional regulator with XRE-family HTH domain
MAAGVGEQVREERLRRGWTLSTLAGRAGISASHLAQLESGKPASLESYARVIVALDRRPQLSAVDARQRIGAGRRDEDFVHAAMGEVEARRLHALGFEVAIDAPYQHYQFAGRADVVAWDREGRALLHLENRTRFPNVQDALGSYGAKRAYLGNVLAERLDIRGGWRSETHVIAGLWSSEILHVLRVRATTFAVTCPDGPERVRAWWSGDIGGLEGVSSSLVLVDPVAGVRDAFRLGELTPSTRPRYRGYAEAAAALRSE